MPSGLRAFSFFAAILLFLSACDQAPPKKEGGEKKAEKPHLVEVALVAREPLRHSTVRTGTLEARRNVRIFNQEEGRIDKLTVREGDTVVQGQILVELDKRLMAAELQKVVANRKQAEADLDRIQQLWKKNVATKERLDRAETAVRVVQAEESLIRTHLDYAEITAPFDGIVTERKIEPGDIAPQHTHLLTLVDPHSLYTKVSVSELMLPSLREGGEAQVRIDALGERVWSARIARIHPTVDARTRQGIVEVDLDPVPEGAAVGQLCRVTLRTPESTKTVLPFAALRHDREGEYVFVVTDGKAAVRRVRTGLRLEDRAEVLEGLNEGDRVVIRGFLDLAPGKAVSIVGKDGAGKDDGGKNGNGQKS